MCWNVLIFKCISKYYIKKLFTSEYNTQQYFNDVFVQRRQESCVKPFAEDGVKVSCMIKCNNREAKISNKLTNCISFLYKLWDRQANQMKNGGKAINGAITQ